MPSERQQIGRYGGLKSWANTVDRTERTARSRANAPGDVDWHLRRLDPVKFADASEKQKQQAAEAARKAYFVELARRSAQARSTKRDNTEK